MYLLYYVWERITTVLNLSAYTPVSNVYVIDINTIYKGIKLCILNCTTEAILISLRLPEISKSLRHCLSWAEVPLLNGFGSRPLLHYFDKRSHSVVQVGNTTLCRWYYLNEVV